MATTTGVSNDDDRTDMATCEDGLVCRNGGVCKGDTTQEGSYYCDCSATPNGVVFAGLSCEFKASVYCNEQNEPSDHSFCTNGGKCKQLITDQDDSVHFGCTCRPKYKGDVSAFQVKVESVTEAFVRLTCCLPLLCIWLQFCEYIKNQNVPSDYAAGTKQSPEPSSVGLGVTLVIVGAVILLVAALGLVVCRRRRLMFWSQHAVGSSKAAMDMDLSVDGGSDSRPHNEKDGDSKIQPTDTVEIFQDAEEDDADDGSDMVDII